MAKKGFGGFKNPFFEVKDDEDRIIDARINKNVNLEEMDNYVKSLKSNSDTFISEEAGESILGDVKDLVNIDEIYTKYDTSSMVDSNVYKVLKFLQTMPLSVDNVTKKTIVLGFLSTTGLDTDSILDDFSEKMEVLAIAEDTIVSELTQTMERNESTIESLNNQIQELRSENSRLSDTITNQRTLINQEKNKLNNINNLLNN